MKIDWYVKLCLGVIALCLVCLTLRPYAPGVALADDKPEVRAVQTVRVEGPVEVQVTALRMDDPVSIKTESYDGIKVQGSVTVEPSYRPLKVEVDR